MVRFVASSSKSDITPAQFLNIAGASTFGFTRFGGGGYGMVHNAPSENLESNEIDMPMRRVASYADTLEQELGLGDRFYYLILPFGGCGSGHLLSIVARFGQFHRERVTGWIVHACITVTKSHSRNRTCRPTFTKAMRRLSTRRRTMRGFTAKMSAACSIVSSRSTPLRIVVGAISTCQAK